MAVSKKEYSAIDAKPVVLYGLTDSASTIAIPILLDANGAVKVSGTALDARYLRAEADTLQTVTTRGASTDKDIVFGVGTAVNPKISWNVTAPAAITGMIELQSTRTACLTELGQAIGSGFFRGTNSANGGQPFYNMVGAAVGNSIFGSAIDGDAYRRFRIYSDGQLWWGSGAVGNDTNLYRGSAGVLQTDYSFKINGTGTITLGSGTSHFINTNAQGIVGISGNYPLLTLTDNSGRINRIGTWAVGSGSAYLTANAYFDGASWQRDNTAEGSVFFSVDGQSGTLRGRFRYANAGANPITPLTAWQINTGGVFQVPKLGAISDSTTAMQFFKADGTTAVMTVDTTNSRVYANGALYLDKNMVTAASSRIGIGGAPLTRTAIYIPTTCVFTDTATNVYGLNFSPTIQNSNTSFSAFYADGVVGDGATITSYYGLRAQNPTKSGTGAITTLYGVYITAQSSGATNWGIYQAGAENNYFAGKVGFGVTPAAKLHSLATTEQLRLGYDASNYLSVTVASGGNTTFQVTPTTGTSPRYGFNTAPEEMFHLKSAESRTMCLMENVAASGSSGGAGFVMRNNDAAAMASGDRLGFMLWAGYDGAANRNSVGFTAWAESAWSSGTFPSYLAVEATTTGTRAEVLRFNGAGMIMADAKNITLNATTGTKIGTATGEKLAFWNATPVAQQAHIADASGGLVVDTEARAAIASINALLATLGLTAAS
jgi:hypothetical protein